ncbi:hypothetical protein NCG89_08040 [Spongiibacter taiwanensis]|uniref:hypothetical protein n=1 Tax=Spongiibacter taiwanensis TaxID=1748242 RepID=UPI002035CB96|nr:hypothetical protein [Spongiibacter taiwanensis]USA44704.1 hypothetical protein NCG89_08040 [Spongiibacter taiwanensis]
MKNISLKVFVIAGILLFGSLYYYSGEVEEHYQANASRYLELALNDISTWQAPALEALLARAARQQVSQEQLQSLMDHYSHLGRFESMEPPKLTRLSAALSIFSEQPRLTYGSNVTFSNGHAVMTATLTLEDQHFKIYNFNLGTASQKAN